MVDKQAQQPKLNQYQADDEPGGIRFAPQAPQKHRQTQIYLVEYKNYLFVLSSHLDEHRPFGLQKPKGPMLVVLVFQIMVRLFFWV